MPQLGILRPFLLALLATKGGFSTAGDSVSELDGFVSSNNEDGFFTGPNGGQLFSTDITQLSFRTFNPMSSGQAGEMQVWKNGTSLGSNVAVTVPVVFDSTLASLPAINASNGEMHRTVGDSTRAAVGGLRTKGTGVSDPSHFNRDDAQVAFGYNLPDFIGSQNLQTALTVSFASVWSGTAFFRFQDGSNLGTNAQHALWPVTGTISHLRVIQIYDSLVSTSTVWTVKTQIAGVDKHSVSFQHGSGTTPAFAEDTSSFSITAGQLLGIKLIAVPAISSGDTISALVGVVFTPS